MCEVGPIESEEDSTYGCFIFNWAKLNLVDESSSLDLFSSRFTQGWSMD